LGIAVLLSLLGFALVVAGGLMFMPDAPLIPVFRAGDWPALIVTFLGAGWSLLGTVQFFRYGRGMFAKAFLAILCVVTVGGAAANAFWVLDLSYRLPPPAVLEPAKPVPAFALTDQDGTQVSDANLRGKPYVLIFSRGVW